MYPRRYSLHRITSYNVCYTKLLRFAAGEVACTGLHGRNRLASNSLLEAVVFGKRVAESINSSFRKLNVFRDQSQYVDTDIKKVIMQNWKIAANEILKVREDLKSELLDY